MAIPHPLVLSEATRFNPLHHQQGRSRSPTRSPIRKAEFTAQELDPLLRNLSPDSTLQALSSTGVVSTGGQRQQDELSKSVANASMAERAVGIKAALAAKIIQQWHAEVSNWYWPDPRHTASGAGFQPPIDSGKQDGNNATGIKAHYLGCLQAGIVEKYEERIEEIKDGLEALDVEDLKEHVLDAHIPSRSRPNTSSGGQETLTTGVGYGRLGDLTAVITATILHALPYLAELNMLISTWDVRIAVLFGIPELVHRLETTNAAVEAALRAVRQQDPSLSFTRSQLETTKESLQSDVSYLGVRIDRALDLLEGREDSLPASWIDEMDDIESSFADWVVEAERKVRHMDWLRQKKMSQNKPLVKESSSRSITGMASEAGRPWSKSEQAIHDDASGPQSMAQNVILPEHPALEAFRHRPVVKPGSRRSTIGSKDAITTSPTGGYDTDAPSREPEILYETPSHRDTMLPIVARSETALNTGNESLSAAPDTPMSVQQQARLMDLVALNHTLSTLRRDDGGESGGHDKSKGLTAHAEQEEPFQFPMRDSGKVQGRQGPKPPLILDLPSAGHRRDISQASFADSAFSETFSDISNAEIVDATSQVLASPRINLVDNPFRASRDDLSTFPSNAKARVQSMHILSRDVLAQGPVGGGHSRSKSLTLLSYPSNSASVQESGSQRVRDPDMLGLDQRNYQDPSRRAAMIHRASTASIEFVPRGHVRRVDSNRKDSQDSHTVSPVDSHGSPADALKDLTASGSVRSVSSGGTGPLGSVDGMTSSSSEPTQLSEHGLPVSRPPTATLDSLNSQSPIVPRKSSMRQSRDIGDLISSSALMDVDSSSTSGLDEGPTLLPSTFSPFQSGQKASQPSATKTTPAETTLQSRIQNILTSLPTRIRLTSEYESEHSLQQSSGSSTRSSTPTPSLTLSPVRQDRLNHRSNANNSEVKVYHLIRNGQPRDAPPTKLHVRLVGGNGERVMVRVGGGWADLAEYLREYSLHHGKRNAKEGRFEVASLPASGPRQNDMGAASASYTQKLRVASRPDAGFDFGTLPSIQPRKMRISSAPTPAETSPAKNGSPSTGDTPTRPPPVPVIPTPYRKESRATSSTSRSRGPSFSTSTTVSPSTPPYQDHNSITTISPTVVTTSTFNSPASATHPSPKYTPLGAAGPKGGIKVSKTRAITYGSPATAAPNHESEAWVQGVVGKARQVSAQNNSSHVASITTPTIITSVSSPPSRKVSAFAAGTPTPSPDSGRTLQTPSPMAVGEHGSADRPRPKSRMSSFGDVSGIRRVFLRSKKEQ